jgi:hypothetical protein
MKARAHAADSLFPAAGLSLEVPAPPKRKAPSCEFGASRGPIGVTYRTELKAKEDVLVPPQPSASSRVAPTEEQLEPYRNLSCRTNPGNGALHAHDAKPQWMKWCGLYRSQVSLD